MFGVYQKQSPDNYHFVWRFQCCVYHKIILTFNRPRIKLAPREVTEITFSDTITDYEGIEKPNPFPGTEEEQTVTVVSLVTGYQPVTSVGLMIGYISNQTSTCHNYEIRIIDSY